MKQVIYLLLSVLMFNFTGCGRRDIEGPPGETQDVSKFDGPYKYLKANEDGTIVIKKDNKEYVFEFLGLSKGPRLSKKIEMFMSLVYMPRQLWLEYDENKISPNGNLQGYAYYENKRVHDVKTGGITFRTFQMLNTRWLWSAGSEFIDDGQTRKYYEVMLECIIKSYKNEIAYRNRGGKQDVGSIWEGRSIKDLETKLTEYEKILADYRAKKNSSNLV